MPPESLTLGTLLPLFLGSSLLAAIAGAFASYLLATKQFERDYHKAIIARRLDVCERVELVMAMLRGSVYEEAPDGSARLAHQPFALGIDGVAELKQAIGSAVVNSLWLEKGTRDLLTELDKLVLPALDMDDDPKAPYLYGVSKYEEVGNLRVRLEKAVTTDLQSFHDVKAFLKRKAKQADPERHITKVMLPRPRHRER